MTHYPLVCSALGAEACVREDGTVEYYYGGRQVNPCELTSVYWAALFQQLAVHCLNGERKVPAS